MSDKLTLAIPSKGRLMEQTTEVFAKAGLVVKKVGHARGYRGEIEGLPGIDVAYVSSSEIAAALKAGSVHLGITGEDLVRESMSDADTRVTFLKALGFGFADVVVAVPACWIDVSTVADLEEAARIFRRVHGRWPRAATKYKNLTRQFFARRGYGDGPTSSPHGSAPPTRDSSMRSKSTTCFISTNPDRLITRPASNTKQRGIVGPASE